MLGVWCWFWFFCLKFSVLLNNSSKFCIANIQLCTNCVNGSYHPLPLSLNFSPPSSLSRARSLIFSSMYVGVCGCTCAFHMRSASPSHAHPESEPVLPIKELHCSLFISIVDKGKPDSPLVFAPFQRRWTSTLLHWGQGRTPRPPGWLCGGHSVSVSYRSKIINVKRQFRTQDAMVV